MNMYYGGPKPLKPKHPKAGNPKRMPLEVSRGPVDINCCIRIDTLEIAELRLKGVCMKCNPEGWRRKYRDAIGGFLK